VKVWPEKTTAKGAVLEPKYHLLPAPLIRTLDAAKKTAPCRNSFSSICGADNQLTS